MALPTNRPCGSTRLARTSGATKKIGRYRDTEWRRYYLHSRGNANSAHGDGALAISEPGHRAVGRFLYNPLNPVPTNGGGLCCYHNAVPGGAFDQTAIEQRDDVLVYTTEALAEETSK